MVLIPCDRSPVFVEHVKIPHCIPVAAGAFLYEPLVDTAYSSMVAQTTHSTHHPHRPPSIERAPTPSKRCFERALRVLPFVVLYLQPPCGGLMAGVSRHPANQGTTCLELSLSGRRSGHADIIASTPRGMPQTVVIVRTWSCPACVGTATPSYCVQCYRKLRAE